MRILTNTNKAEIVVLPYHVTDVVKDAFNGDITEHVSDMTQLFVNRFFEDDEVMDELMKAGVVNAYISPFSEYDEEEDITFVEYHTVWHVKTEVLAQIKPYLVRHKHLIPEFVGMKCEVLLPVPEDLE